MTKNIFILLFLLTLAGCKSATQYGFPENLIPKVSNNDSDSYSFVILGNYLDRTTYAPIIEHKANNQNFYMAIDTGASFSAFLRPKVEQLVSDEVLKMAEQFTPYSENRITIDFTGEDLKYTIDPLGKNTTGEKYNYFDGFLGEDYLMKFKNVVFDYTKCKFYVNQEPICEKTVPMYKHDEADIFLMDIEVNGEKTKAIIDTGCKFIFLGILENQKVKNNEINYVDIKIGDVKFNHIEIGTTDELITNEKAFEIMESYNIIGYPCFKDHVIQLDFEHNKFRIK